MISLICGSRRELLLIVVALFEFIVVLESSSFGSPAGLGETSESFSGLEGGCDRMLGLDVFVHVETDDIVSGAVCTNVGMLGGIFWLTPVVSLCKVEII